MGKQVRDNLHAEDLAKHFSHFFETQPPRRSLQCGRRRTPIVGDRAIRLSKTVREKNELQLFGQNRIGDHIWYISDLGRFKSHYPEWDIRIGVDHFNEEIVTETERSLVAGEEPQPPCGSIIHRSEWILAGFAPSATYPGPT